MASVDALKEMLLPICVITLVSTILIMIVTGPCAITFASNTL